MPIICTNTFNRDRFTWATFWSLGMLVEEEVVVEEAVVGLSRKAVMVDYTLDFMR